MRKPRTLRRHNHELFACESADIGLRGEVLQPRYVVIGSGLGDAYTESAGDCRRYAAWLLKSADWLEEDPGA